MPKLIPTSSIVKVGLASQKSLFISLGVSKKEFASILGYEGKTYSCAYEMANGLRAIPVARIPELMYYLITVGKHALRNQWTCAILQSHGYRTHTKWLSLPISSPQQFLQSYDKAKLVKLGASARAIRYMRHLSALSLDELFFAIVKYHTQCPLIGSDLIIILDEDPNIDWDHKASMVHTIFLRNDGWML